MPEPLPKTFIAAVAVSLLPWMTMGCASTAELLQRGDYAAACARLDGEGPTASGESFAANDPTAVVAAAVRRDQLDASYTARALSTKELSAYLGLTPEDYGDSWLVVATRIDMRSGSGPLLDVHPGLFADGGLWVDFCHENRCTGDMVLMDLDDMMGAERPIRKSSSSPLSGLLGGLLGAGAGLFVDLPISIASLGLVDPELRLTAPKAVSDLFESQPGLRILTDEDELEQKLGALREELEPAPPEKDDNRRRLMAAERLYRLVAHPGCVLEDGHSCVRVWLLDRAPLDGLPAAAPARAFALRFHHLLGHDDVCFATERLDLPLGAGDLATAVNEVFHGRPLTLAQLAERAGAASP